MRSRALLLGTIKKGTLTSESRKFKPQVESSVPPSASRPGRGSESPRESLPSHAHRDPEVCITQDQNHVEPSDLHLSSQPPWPLKSYWLEPIFSLSLKASDIAPEMDSALIERKLSKYRRSSHSALLKEQFYGHKYVRRAFFKGTEWRCNSDKGEYFRNHNQV